jgi:hypothetical protein
VEIESIRKMLARAADIGQWPAEPTVDDDGWDCPV